MEPPATSHEDARVLSGRAGWRWSMSALCWSPRPKGGRTRRSAATTQGGFPIRRGVSRFVRCVGLLLSLQEEVRTQEKNGSERLADAPVGPHLGGSRSQRPPCDQRPPCGQ